MKNLAILLIFCILVTVSCAFQSGPRHYDEDYEIWFEKEAANGMITIITNPDNALVYLIDEEGESVVDTSPATIKVKATGKPYYFRIVKDGYYDYRFPATPTPMNPSVEAIIELDKIISVDGSDETETTANGYNDRKTLSYDDRIVGESNAKVQPKMESRVD